MAIIELDLDESRLAPESLLEAFKTQTKHLKTELAEIAKEEINSRIPFKVEKSSLPPLSQALIDRAHPNLHHDDIIYLSVQNLPSVNPDFRIFQSLVIGWQPASLGMISCLKLGLWYPGNFGLDCFFDQTVRTHGLTKDNTLSFDYPVNPADLKARELVNDWVKPEHQFYRNQVLSELVPYFQPQFDKPYLTC